MGTVKLQSNGPLHTNMVTGTLAIDGWASTFWLPVRKRKRTDFKLALTSYKILSTHQPAYLCSLLFPYEPMRALCSSSQQLLNVPTVTTDFGRRAFSYCAPKIWNKIPAAIRNTPTVQTFKYRLKTHLFSLMNHP